MHYPVVVRMDDIFPGMNESLFLKYKAMLDELGIKPLLGIIPDCWDKTIQTGNTENFWGKMRELKELGWPIAMHGCHHLYTSHSRGLVSARPKSEFAGLSEQEQLHLLTSGRNILRAHGLDTDIFMAPGHSYDKTTMKALKKAGFRTITDGRSMRPYLLEGILCIPAESAYRLHIAGLLTVCVHCCAETERDFAKLKHFLERRRADVISFDEACRISQNPYWISRGEEIISMNLNGMIACSLRTFRKMTNR